MARQQPLSDPNLVRFRSTNTFLKTTIEKQCKKPLREERGKTRKRKLLQMTTNVTKLNEKTAYEKLPTTNTVKHSYVRTSTYCRWSILKAKGGFYFANVCNNTWKLFWSNEYQSICLVVYVPCCILSPIRCHVIKISKQSKEEVLLKFPITNPLKKHQVSTHKTNIDAIGPCYKKRSFE